MKAIHSMFRFYDLEIRGTITRERAIKILQAIGVDDLHVGTLHTVVTCKELLQYIDNMLPDPDPPLQSELISFTKLVAKTDAVPGEEVSASTYTPMIKPKGIVDFYESTDQPVPNSSAVVTSMLSSMLEWDDCSEEPAIHPSNFIRDVTKFAKKTNALRDFV